MNKNRNRITQTYILVCIFASISFAQGGTTYYVATTGDDSHDGLTLGTPFSTIGVAAAVMQAGDTCTIREGIYRETVIPAANGTADHPIIFQSYPDESVVISGCDVLTGWTGVGQGIWATAMHRSMAAYRNQLFINGSAMTKARWPNVADNDPLTPEGAVFDLAHSNMSQAQPIGGFPLDWTAITLDGAAIWVMAQSKWRAWNSGVTGYDPVTGIVSFQRITQSWYVNYMNPGKAHKSYGDGIFFLSGSYGLLDAPGEWWYDASNQTMFLIPPVGVNPAAPETVITAKRRDYGFILDDRSHIHLENLVFRGTAASLVGAQSCHLGNLKFYDFDFREGETHFSVNPYYRSEGIFVSGQNNVIRECEFTRCSDAGVTLLGEDNALINCYLHEVDYAGYDGGPINLGGMRHLVSHNTVERTSRKAINPNGLGHLIQYNDLKEVGLVTRDLAAIFAGGLDAGNTVIRYNWINVTNGNTEGYGSGIYFDNWHQNVIVHHNIVWNPTTNGLQPNRPAHYDVWAHNSVQGRISTNYGPWQGQDTMFGTFIHNNWSTDKIDEKGYVTYSKVANLLAPLNLDFSSGKPVPNRNAEGRNIGTILPGINDGYIGSAPDIGALENRVLDWNAGHDFNAPPHPVYEPASCYYRNYVINGSFDFERADYRPRLDKFHGWIQTGLAASIVNHHSGFNFPDASTRNSIYANSVHLRGNGNDGIEQTIIDLPVGQFCLAAYIRLVPLENSVADVKLSVVRDRKEIASILATTVSLSNSQKWRLVKTSFNHIEAGDVSIRITKLGKGEAYIDNIGVVPHYMDTTSF